MLAVNISYDTDGEDVAGLPDTLDIPDDIHVDDIADFISDVTGWCVLSFDLI